MVTERTCILNGIPKGTEKNNILLYFFPITCIAFNILTSGKNCSWKQNKWSSSQEAISVSAASFETLQFLSNREVGCVKSQGRKHLQLEYSLLEESLEI